MNRTPQIIALIKQGKSTTEIVQAVGCHEVTVYRVARDNGLEAHRPGFKRYDGTANISMRYVKGNRGKQMYHSARIPESALRAAGLLNESRLAFVVQGEQIIVRRVETLLPPAGSNK